MGNVILSINIENKLAENAYDVDKTREENTKKALDYQIRKDTKKDKEKLGIKKLKYKHKLK